MHFSMHAFGLLRRLLINVIILDRYMVPVGCPLLSLLDEHIILESWPCELQQRGCVDWFGCPDVCGHHIIASYSCYIEYMIDIYVHACICVSICDYNHRRWEAAHRPPLMGMDIKIKVGSTDTGQFRRFNSISLY